VVYGLLRRKFIGTANGGNNGAAEPSPID
jgi:hypothetical protein